MSKEKIELRKEVYDFMEKQGHELKLTLDGNAIPYGIVNHLIAAFYEYKMEELNKLHQDTVNNVICPSCKSDFVVKYGSYTSECQNCGKLIEQSKC